MCDTFYREEFHLYALNSYFVVLVSFIDLSNKLKILSN